MVPEALGHEIIQPAGHLRLQFLRISIKKTRNTKVVTVKNKLDQVK